MASISTFLNELGGIPGISGYLLIGDNGQPVAETIQEAGQVGAMLRVVLMSTSRIQSALGLPRLQHIYFGDAEGGRLLVFPLGRYHLGVAQADISPGYDLAGKILELIKRYQTRP